MPPVGQPITLIDTSGVTRYVGTFIGLPFLVGPAVFNFDDPGLEDGLQFYVPVIGGFLLDGWVEITTAWDGGQAYADIGQFTGPGQVGYFGSVELPLSMGAADADDPSGLYRQNLDGADPSALSTCAALKRVRLVPARWSSAEPLKIVVSQDGRSGGGDPGATQGQGAVYLVVAASAVQP